jgi:hypothetical protein
MRADWSHCVAAKGGVEGIYSGAKEVVYAD